MMAGSLTPQTCVQANGNGCEIHYETSDNAIFRVKFLLFITKRADNSGNCPFTDIWPLCTQFCVR